MSRFAPGFLKRSITPGSTTYATAGTYSFSWPDADTVTIELNGAGGAGSGANNSFVGFLGTDGGNTTIASLSLSAGGGKHGGTGSQNTSVSGLGANGAGAGGTASGFNTTNTSGNPGVSCGTLGVYPDGGSSPNGGAGGVYNRTTTGTPGGAGGAPGGGGSSGNMNGEVSTVGGGAGGGAYGKHIVPGSLFAVGATVTVVVGAKGVHLTATGTNAVQGGDGADGRAIISWA